jgi:hypothetical protein
VRSSLEVPDFGGNRRLVVGRSGGRSSAAGRDAEDPVDAFDAAGMRIGRGTRRDGSLVRWVEVEAEP